MKLARLVKMCVTETYSRVRESKHFSDMFPIGNGLKHIVITNKTVKVHSNRLQ